MNPVVQLRASEKKDLLKSLLSEGKQAGRLTEAQARLWELESHANCSGVHDFSLAYSMLGPLDAGMLEEALWAAVGRHPSMRVRVAEQNQSPVFESVELPQPILERSECTTSLDALLRREASKPINPAVGPGWKAILFRASENEHTLLLHFHHIVADRWSVGILISDVGAAYRSLCDGQMPLFTPSPAQWTLNNRGPGETDASLAYWSELFAPPVEELQVPAAAQRGFAGYTGDRIELELDQETSAALNSEAVEQGLTLFPVLLAAFAAFLHSYTGQEDLTICTPISGRQGSATRWIMGYFNNILPLRISLAGDPEFRKLASEVAAQARTAATHQAAQFHRIAELPQLAGQRMTRCLFTMQNIPGLELKLPNIQSSYRDVPNGTANFDLSLFAERQEGRLRLLLDYKTALLEKNAALQLSTRFLEFLRAVALQ